MNEEKKKLKLNNIFYHNSFVLVFSLLCAIVIWFAVGISNSDDKPRYIYDVPIEIQLSESAKEEGIRIFAQSYATADVSITGNSVVVRKVTADDLTVTASLTPNSTKLSGNTLVNETLQLVATKKGNVLADYEVESVSPKEINVLYDRYEETTFAIENNLQYTVAGNYYAATPELSADRVVVSGPATYVDRVSRVSLEYQIPDPLSGSTEITCGLTLYDSNGKVISLEDTYLQLSVESVDVSIPVWNKQTVQLEVPVVNMPEGFSESRVVIEPATIDIAGDYETISGYRSITLPATVDFNSINLKNNSFTVEIPMPANVRNVTNVTEATVTVNLNGFNETTVNATEFNIVNVPDDKEVSLITKTLPVSIIGSPAQLARLDPGSVFVTIDMAQLTDMNGNREVPAAVTLSGVTSCWVYGKYTVQVSVGDKRPESSEGAINANPNDASGP